MSAFAAFAAHADALTWEGSTNLAMTAATTVEVPAGRTNVIVVLDGAYELTKTGCGTLEIRYVKNEGVQLDIAEGAVHFTNPRPDDVFAEASIHLDATDLASLDVVTANGTNYVRQWRDTDGRDRWATNCTTVSGNRTDPNRLAFLHMDGAARRPVVDFGALLETSSTYMSTPEALALAYGAAMTLDSQVGMYEGFSVFSDTEDYSLWTAMGATVRGMTPMSSVGGPWSRGPCNASGLSYWSADGNPGNYYFPQKTGMTNIICDLVIQNKSTPRYTNVPKGFHMVRIIPERKPLAVTHLAAQSVYKSVVYGGQKIGEYVLFDHSLLEKDADAVSYYLMAKWFPQTFAGVKVHAGASLLVDDDVTLAPGYFSDENNTADFSAGRGVTIFDPLAGGNVLLRLDATRTDRMEIVQENGTNFVARWYDANGLDTHAATNMCPGKFNHRANPERRMPFITEGRTATGRPVVDFGTPSIYQQYKTTTELLSEPTGYGASMIFSKDLSISEFILVVEDNEAITNKYFESGNYHPGVSYLAYNKYTPTSGNFTGGNAAKRGSLAKGLVPPLYAGGFAPFSVSGGAQRHYLDNVSCASSARPPLGRFYVLDSVGDGAATFNRLARTLRTDSESTADCYGGMRFAELLLFKTRLPERERDRVNRLMRAKWFGDEYVKSVHSYARLRVPVDGTMTIAHDPAVVTEELSIGGTLAVPEGLSAAAINVTADGAEIDAAVTLAEDAELVFPEGENGMGVLKVASLALSESGVVRIVVPNPDSLRHQKVKLVDCDDVTGSLSGWHGSVPGYPCGAALSLESDGIYAELISPRTLLFVR